MEPPWPDDFESVRSGNPFDDRGGSAGVAELLHLIPKLHVPQLTEADGRYRPAMRGDCAAKSVPYDSGLNTQHKV